VAYHLCKVVEKELLQLKDAIKKYIFPSSLSDDIFLLDLENAVGEELRSIS
jgi:hypothetical protein